MELIAEEYRQTEVGLIPVDWEVKKIRQVCKLINGRGFKPFEWKREGLPIIRIQNLNGSDDYNYFQGSYDKKLEVEDGQLLFAWSGSRGTSFGPHIWKGSKGLLNYHTWKINVNEGEIFKPFFNHALKRLTKEIEDKAHGASALVHTQKWEMEGYEFAMPPSEIEQTAIATALSDADALISSLEKLIAKKRNIKQGAMQKLLEPKEGWEVKKLGKVAPLQRGFDLPNRDLFKGKYPVVYSNGIVNYHHKFQAKAPGIVTGRSGTIGKVNFIQEDYWPHNTTLWVTNFMGNYPLFVYFLFLKVGLERFATGSGVPTLNRNDVHDFAVSIPDYDVQASIANILSDMDAEINALEAKLVKYRNVKLGMMQNLLTGKIRLI